VRPLFTKSIAALRVLEFLDRDATAANHMNTIASTNPNPLKIIILALSGLIASRNPVQDGVHFVALSPDRTHVANELIQLSHKLVAVVQQLGLRACAKRRIPE
jgi:hypothetical protein